MNCLECGKYVPSGRRHCSKRCARLLEAKTVLNSEHVKLIEKDEFIADMRANFVNIAYELRVITHHPYYYKEIVEYNKTCYKFPLERSKGSSDFPQMLYNYMFNITEPDICPVCGCRLKFWQFNFKGVGGYGKTCGRTCGNKVGQATIKTNMIKLHGVEHHSQKPNYKASFKNKIINTFYKKDLTDYEIIDLNTDEYIVTFKCKICDRINTNMPIEHFYNRRNRRLDCCLHCNPPSKPYSNAEEEVKAFINENGIIGERDRTVLEGKEIDIFIKDKNIGIEYNGLYWHSEEYFDPEDHLTKSINALKKGVNLIHIWEDDWLYKTDIVKSRINVVLGKTATEIDSDLCSIRYVDSKTSSNFLINNHLQGPVLSKIKLGLFHNDELVSLMAFGSLKNNPMDNHYELLRFVNKLNINVVGAASKLLKHFEAQYSPERVISYVDCDWNINWPKSLYVALGFKYVTHTGPDYWWIINGVRKNRRHFQHHILVRLGYDENKTENEIMHERGCARIYGTGSYKFEKVYSVPIIS